MLKNNTAVTREEDIKREWHLVDAKSQVLGRLAVRAANLLMGKNKTCFSRRVDCGDHVVVINAQEIKLTGKKTEQKIYQRYSGYPGGRKEVSFTRMISQRPEQVIRQAVMGMLPKNKLRSKMITRLYVFAGQDHSFKEKFIN